MVDKCILKHKGMFLRGLPPVFRAYGIEAFKRIFGHEIKEVIEGWAMWHNRKLQFVVFKPNQGG
jgi:hypothetical protein